LQHFYALEGRVSISSTWLHDKSGLYWYQFNLAHECLFITITLYTLTWIQ